MNIAHLSDPELLHATFSAAGREKRATLQLLEHLLEIDRRDLALREGHPSLWAYVHHGLGYSEGAASARGGDALAQARARGSGGVAGE